MATIYNNPILIAAAIIPAVILLILIYKADKIDKEPPMLLLSLVIQGIVVTALAASAERICTVLLDRAVEVNTVVYNAILYFVIVGCVEEGFKYLLLRFRTWRSPAFNCQFDAVVYSVFVSLGFALWENINYVVVYGFAVACIRAVTAVPGHACFGVFMGAFYGLAKRYDIYGYKEKSKLCRALSFVVPAFIHGCYDFITTIENIHAAWIFVGFICVLFIFSVILVRRLSRSDRYIQ